MKGISRIFFIIVIVIVVFIVGKNIFVKFAVEKGVRVATGLPLEIKKMDIGLLSTHFGIKDLTLYNPSGFPKEPMFHAPEIYVDYKLGSFASGNIHLEDIRLDFDEFVIVKNKDGQLNLNALMPEKKEDEPKKVDDLAKKKDKKKGLEYQIDHMSVKIGKVVFKDYSKGGEPSIKEKEINFSEEFTNINNSNITMTVLTIIPKVLIKSDLTSLVNFNIDILSDTVGIPMQTVDTLKDAASTLTDKIKLPFGK